MTVSSSKTLVPSYDLAVHDALVEDGDVAAVTMTLAEGTTAPRNRGSLDMRSTSLHGLPSTRFMNRFVTGPSRRAGLDVLCHTVDVLRRHAVVHPLEPERCLDLGRQHITQAAADPRVG